MSGNYFNGVFNGNIPNNKLVKISDSSGNDPTGGVPLIYDDDLTIKVKSSFAPLGNAKGNPLLTVLSSQTGGVIPSGQFELQNIQIWESTDPLEFDFSVKLYMKDDAKKDVVTPVQKLMGVCVPSVKDSGSGEALGMLIPPGPKLSEVLKEGLNANDSWIGKRIGGSDSTSGSGKMYTIRVGKFKFPLCIITGVEPTFSNICDEKGYPVKADVTISVRTIKVATTGMIGSIV